MNSSKLLSSSNSKKLLFLEILNNSSPQWISKEQLSKDMNVSINGLNLLYNAIKGVHLFSNSDVAHYLEVNSHLGFRIYKNINTIMDTIKLELLNKEISFNLLTMSFRNNYISKTFFLEKMFISRATLYREIAKIQVFLSPYELVFNSKNGEIIGELTKLRKFYFHLFWSTYKTGEWPFFTLNYTEIETLIQEFEHYAQISLTYVQRRKFSFILAIVFSDLSKNQFCEKNFVSIEKKDRILSGIQKLFTKRYYLISDEKIQSEINYVYLFFITTIDSGMIMMNYEENDIGFNLKNSSTYECAEGFMKHLIKAYPNLLESIEEKRAVFSNIVKLFFELDCFGVNYIEKKLTKIDCFYQPFYLKLKKIITEYYEKEALADSSNKASIFADKVFEIIYFSTNIKKISTEYQIIVLSEELLHKNYIEKRIMESIPLNIKFLDESFIFDQADLIITDRIQVSQLVNTPIFTIIDLLNEKNWEEIKNILSSEKINNH